MKAMRLVKLTFLLVTSLALVACGGGSYQDLDEFMAETKARPAGVIKPIPAFKAYKSFTYSASGMRSPFQRPVEVKEIALLQASTTVKPDPNRPKEFLEQFGIDSLAMVGTIQMGGTLWALMEDAKGGVHRVKRGNYLGRNHGRIVELTESQVSVIEIVPNGPDLWIERPRTLKLKSTE